MCFWDFLLIFILMRIISGIYRIVNTKNDKSYIGSSKNIIRRWYIHKSALKNNRHHSIYLQRSWNKHGEQSFKFEILKQLDNPSEDQLFKEELKHITELLPQYNIGDVGGGDNLTNNPNREDIIRRMTETLREQVSKMSEQERKERWGRPMDKNPNWKGGQTICECGARISSINQTCSECRSRSGQQNPFYGKHHSQKTITNLSDKMKGRLPTNTNPIILNGVSYTSQADAARKLGVSIGSISNCVRGKFKRRLAS